VGAKDRLFLGTWGIGGERKGCVSKLFLGFVLGAVCGLPLGKASAESGLGVGKSAIS
jgi:hypothetical protein